MSKSASYWSGMPPGMKGKLVAWLAFLGIAVFVLAHNPIFGVVLLMLPLLWSVVLLWVSGKTGLAFGPFRQQTENVPGYTARYLWNAPFFTRAFFSFVATCVVVGGLAWISTEKLRAQATKPTFAERATAIAETATDATKETASGWLATSKGWFRTQSSEE